MLILNNIQHKYETKTVLNSVSLSLKKGEIGTLIGSSGSGKSTVFKLLSGILPLQSGSCIVSEENAQNNRHLIAYMMQEDLLLPWRTVLNNLVLLTELGKNSKQNIDKIPDALSLLSDMSLTHTADMFPHELSLGMRQRISLARALLQQRPILLLDEPFSFLDVALREQMYLILRKVQQSKQTTMLMVTHDFRDALSLSDRIFFLNHGRIEETWEVSNQTRSDPYESGKILNEMKKAIISTL